MGDKTKLIDEQVDKLRDDLIRWRRHLHQHPELSFEEKDTSQFVYNTLESIDGLELSRPTPTSVVAKLKGNQAGKVLAIRADMDALPILEENEFEFTSENPGVMHACGHDGHTAMLLGTAKLMSQFRDDLNGEIRFVFQHAEELHPGGAQQLVDAGVMDGVDLIIGIHLQALREIGTLAVAPGRVNAASDRFDLTIIGRGGHAAYPHAAVDSVAIAAQVITNLQHLVSRHTDPLEPLVLSLTKVKGGTADNVIPGSVEIGGTVRSYKIELQDLIPARMERVIQGITEAHGGTYIFDYRKGYRPVINDEAIAGHVREALVEAFGEEAVHVSMPSMGGEDFSAYLQKVPGVFFHVGAGNQEKGIVYPHHHPKFSIDEDALPIGVKAFAHAAFKLLNLE